MQPGVAYGSVINDLIKMMSLSCPSDKLATLGVFPTPPAPPIHPLLYSEPRPVYIVSAFRAVRASKSVFQCIEDYYNKFEDGQCPKQSSM